MTGNRTFLNRSRRSVVVGFVVLIVYLFCFNAIRLPGAAIGDEGLWNAGFDQVFVLPTITTENQVSAETDRRSHNKHGINLKKNRPETGRRMPVEQDVVVGNDNSTATVTTRTTTTTENPMPATTNIPRLPVIPKPNPFPPPSIVQAWMQNETNETAGQFMLDFAIIGFAKCGTSTMMTWLGQQPNIFVPPREQTILKKSSPSELVNRLYKPVLEDQKLLGDSNYLFKTNNVSLIEYRGYKSPNDVDDFRSLRLLREFFPKTKLILGIRHPVLMMQSFYNFRVQNGFPIRDFKLIGWGNMAKSFGVAWSRAAYHSSLINLGKTDLNTTDEINLMPKQQQKEIRKKGATAMFTKSPHPVFLYEVSQLKHNDQNDNLELFLQEFENFLGLDEPLPPPVHDIPGQNLDDAIQAERDAKKIDICEPRYIVSRNFLVEIGRNVAEWILNYFIHSPDVYVANPDHFRSLLVAYSKDPCKGRPAETTNTNNTTTTTTTTVTA